MNEVTVAKQELLTVLRENRAQHRTIFEEALKGFHRQALRQLEEQINRLDKGYKGTVFVQVAPPQDHTRDYDRAIRMIEMALGETIKVTEDDFQAYVMDDWNWQRQFIGTASTYGSATATARNTD